MKMGLKFCVYFLGTAIIAALTLATKFAAPAIAQNILSVDIEAERARLLRLAAQGKALNPSAVLAQQKNLIDRRIREMKPGKLGTVDMFVLGFAGDGTQDVFLHELEYAQKSLNERYATQNRSLLFVNNLRSTHKYPLATLENLQRGLKSIAGKMNIREDVLLLFATSHGSPDRTLSVQLPAFQMNALSANHIRSALDASGITNRIIIISACYSGGFIPVLENENTAIWTASAFNRTSFGCSNDRKLTYFGDAFFQQSLPKAASLEDAFDKSMTLIADWERRDSLEHSQPMSSIGTQIRPLLVSIERKISAAK
jgi:Peptidase C13 family